MSYSIRLMARSHWRHVTVLGALVLYSTACDTTEFLGVEDPDIINPSDVQSAAGANAVRLGALSRLNSASSGGESMLLLGGLFTDEWINGDSFIGENHIRAQQTAPEADCAVGHPPSDLRAAQGLVQVDLRSRFGTIKHCPHQPLQLRRTRRTQQKVR